MMMIAKISCSARRANSSVLFAVMFIVMIGRGSRGFSEEIAVESEIIPRLLKERHNYLEI